MPSRWPTRLGSGLMLLGLLLRIPRQWPLLTMAMLGVDRLEHDLRLRAGQLLPAAACFRAPVGAGRAAMSGGFTLAGELDLILPITALLPLTAVLLVSQANPYQTLVLRGILGSVATLLYALLGAPDVAITEALVGTLLSTTLYAVALRSSMALRLSFPQGHGPMRNPSGCCATGWAPPACACPWCRRPRRAVWIRASATAASNRGRRAAQLVLRQSPAAGAAAVPGGLWALAGAGRRAAAGGAPDDLALPAGRHGPLPGAPGLGPAGARLDPAADRGHRRADQRARTWCPA